MNARQGIYIIYIPCRWAWQFAANLKMCDVSDDSYLYAVAAAAASVVLTVDIYET